VVVVANSLEVVHDMLGADGSPHSEKVMMGIRKRAATPNGDQRERGRPERAPVRNGWGCRIHVRARAPVRGSTFGHDAQRRLRLLMPLMIRPVTGAARSSTSDAVR